MNIQKRLQNKAFWTAMACFIALMAKQFGWFEVPENYEQLVDLALGLAVMAGILIDPTTEGIKDGEKHDA